MSEKECPLSYAVGFRDKACSRKCRWFDEESNDCRMLTLLDEAVRLFRKFCERIGAE